MKILVTGHYVDPTTSDNPRTIMYTSICDNVQEAIDFVREHFDGQETYDTVHTPRIIEHFNESNEDYHLDDWSAGQWFWFVPTSKTFELVQEI
jgi:hypothetical protein